jgi:hypothetical protein
MEAFMPTRKLLTALAGLVLVAGSVSTLGAADLPFNPGVKFRFGVVGGALQEDLNKNQMVGFSLTADLMTWGSSTLFGELTYTTISGDQKTAMFKELKDGGSPFPGGTVEVNDSADTRKNGLAGFGLRAGYRAPLAWGWNYQAGLTLDSLKYTQEALGYLTPTVEANESIATKCTTNKLNVGAFAGLHRPFGDFSFEVNVSTVGYSSINYVPRVYSGLATATTETSTRRGIMLDIALGLKF